MADEFLTTRWSMVLAAGQGADDGGAALDYICRTSWRPLYAFARRSGLGREDAEDAVQGFIASLLSRNSLQTVAQEKGRFRTFLLASLKHHLSDGKAKAHALKRGGGAQHVPLDMAGAEAEFELVDVHSDTPDRAYDRAWALDLFQRARNRLASECAASGKGPLFAALFPPGSQERAEPYEVLSPRLGIPVNTLRSHTLRLRQRLAELIRSEIADTVNSSDAFESELESFRSALSA
jgi:DNA-directed RNA polymerase specialized sigma24 family protein